MVDFFLKASSLLRCPLISGRFKSSESQNPATQQNDHRARKSRNDRSRSRSNTLFAPASSPGRPSRQLGKNFICHPNAKVLGVYPFEIKGWQGVSQGGQIREFHDEGIVMAENFISPGALAAQIPFIGDDAMDLMKDYNRMMLTGVLVEDSRPGEVKRSHLGFPVPLYDITDYDHARFLKGVRDLATLHFEMGAEKVLLPFSNMHIVTSVDDLKKIEASQTNPNTLELFTVHLMGTCKMGHDEKKSVVDLSGQLWDLPGCYVSDASLFPTAIGVNPQVTIMALALQVARRLRLPN